MTHVAAYNLATQYDHAEQAAQTIRHGRSLAERLADADASWLNYVDMRKGYAASGREPSLRLCVAHISVFFLSLIKSADLRLRAVDHFNLSLTTTIVAGKAWQSFITTARSSGPRLSPACGALLRLELAAFLESFIKGEDVRARILDDFVVQMNDERPPEQGKLI